MHDRVVQPTGTVSWLTSLRDNRLFAASTSGVWQSHDHGQSWHLFAATGDFAVVEPMVRQDSSVVMLGGGDDGLFRFAEGMTQVRHLVGDCQVNAMTLSQGQTPGAIALVGTDADGILRSIDGGEQWTLANAGLLDYTVLAVALSPDLEHDQFGLAGTESGLYQTKNGAQSWRSLDLPVDDPAVQAIAFSPNFAVDRMIFVGTEGDGLYCSRDAGSNWTAIDALGASISAISVNATGKTIVVGAEAGIYASIDAGQTWTLIVPDSPVVLSFAFAGSSEGTTVLAGCLDAGLLRLSIG